MSQITTWAEFPAYPYVPGVLRQAVCGEKVMMTRITYQGDVTIPAHKHEAEQIMLVVQGRLWAKVGEEEQEVGPGALLIVNSNIIHAFRKLLCPETLIAKFEKWGLYGIFPSHQWNVTGWSDEYYSNTQIQVFLTFLPGDGWNVGTTPIMNYDWKSRDWTIPLNLTVSKTVMYGKLPVKLQVEVNYYVEQPDAFGPEWMVGINITPVVPNIIEGWIRGM